MSEDKPLVVPKGWLLALIETIDPHRWGPITLEQNVISTEAIRDAIDAIHNDTHQPKA